MVCMFGGWLVSLVVGLFTFCLLVCLFSGWLVSLVVGLLSFLFVGLLLDLLVEFFVCCFAC